MTVNSKKTCWQKKLRPKKTERKDETSLTGLKKCKWKQNPPLLKKVEETTDDVLGCDIWSDKLEVEEVKWKRKSE